jgi:hypothetical protein
LEFGVTKKQSAVVDEVEVNYWVDYVRPHGNFAATTPEDRADTMYRVLTKMSQLDESQSKDWWNELARNVRQRLLWAKPLAAEESKPE